jgi:aspartate/methionine/tyrosine aminotransferase
MSADRWISDRLLAMRNSGIRRIFELTRSLRDPINLSIGQPDFDVDDPVKAAAHAAIDAGLNAYTLTQGIPELRAKLLSRVQTAFPTHANRELIVTSGTSGALMTALCATVNPGDEVILFDPYFVLYPQLIYLTSGKLVTIDTYPDQFGIDVDKVRKAITPRTKVILLNSPNNPTGRVYPTDQVRDLALLARERDVLLISDEIYRAFCYDGPFVSPAEFNEDVLVIDGFSKAYAMTGWRLGYAHGPRRLIEEMTKLQQFSFVCAPSIVQHAALTALDLDLTGHVADYRRKRDRIVAGLRPFYDLVVPEGAFYAFPRAPFQPATAFVEESIRRSLLLIPGSVFSERDTHFRISYAAPDQTIDRGLEVFEKLARG